jgi:hypothetical protein
MAQNEVLLVIGILISSAIILLELSNIFVLQGKFVQGSLISNFKKDIESRVDKAAAAADNADFTYSPQLKQYTFNTSNNLVSIKDKISGAEASFFKLTPKIDDNSFEDSKTIHIVKRENKILIFADYQAKQFLT